MKVKKCKQGQQGPQTISSLKSLKIQKKHRYRHLHSRNHQKWLPYQILGGKIVKMSKLIHKSKRDVRELVYISYYRESKHIKIGFVPIAIENFNFMNFIKDKRTHI